MTLHEANKLKIGQIVVWPEGANECGYAEGTVENDFEFNTRYILWPDNQRTYLHDEYAVRFIEAKKR